MIDKVKLNKHYIWDILEIDWSEVKVTFNGKVISLPKSIMVRLWDKFKVRHMMGSQPILFHLMLSDSSGSHYLRKDRRRILPKQIKIFIISENGKRNKSRFWLYFLLSMYMFIDRHSWCRTDYKNGKGDINLLQWSHSRIHCFLIMEQECDPLSFLKMKDTGLSRWQFQTDDNMEQWCDTPIFCPTKTTLKPQKHAPGKTRTRWSNHNHQFNPIRTNRYNTLDTNLMIWIK